MPPRNAPHEPQDWARYKPGSTDGTTLMQAHFTEHAFERHSHDTYSIAVTSSGVQTFHCNGSLHASLPGDFILFNPDQAHDGRRGTAEGFGYDMLYISADAMADCRDTSAGIDFGEHFTQPVVRDPGLAQAFRRLVSAEGQPQERLRAEALMRQFIAALLTRHGESRNTTPLRRAAALPLKRVREYLQAHYPQDIAVAQLARQAGLSRAHLTRAFTQHFGISPHVYLNAVRLHHARHAILQGHALADVAASCGFADQSHFTRRYKGAAGLTPSQWARQMRASPTRR